MRKFYFYKKGQWGQLGALLSLSLLSMAVPAAANTVPLGSCPAGTHQSALVPNSHVCIKDPLVTVCPAGTVEPFLGSNTCLLDPLSIPKYVTPLVIPPVMPKSTAAKQGAPAAEYNIAVRQFKQQILPGGIWNTLNGRADSFNPTTVWSYGRAEDPLPTGGVAPATNSSFNYPAYTVEATLGDLDTVRWINDLKDASGKYLPHLFAVDQTLHWANPTKDCRSMLMNGVLTQMLFTTNCEGMSDLPYQGPVPMIPHVHGAHVNPQSDGYPEAWWLPAANNLPAGIAIKGSLFDQYNRTNTTKGTGYFGYENDQPASTIWYHDHSLGMTRLNVYAGPAGFWLIRGGANGDDFVDNAATPAIQWDGVLPGPAPVAGETVVDANFPAALGGQREKYREMPIAIQDRSFTPDGSLFYPESRAFFEAKNTVNATNVNQLQIPFINSAQSDTVSDISPIWTPEAFFTTMVVNGSTWPVMEVAPDRYRLRLLDGCNSRTLNLSMFVYLGPGLDGIVGTADDVLGAEIPFYQIGAEQGFLPKVVKIQTGTFSVLPGDGTAGTPQALPTAQHALLMGPAERADVIVDFSGMADGTTIRMINTAPDAPFGGFPDPAVADQSTTGQIMQFVVKTANLKTDGSNTDGATTAPENLVLPAAAPLGAAINAGSPRRVSLDEEESGKVCVWVDPTGNVAAIPGVAFDPKNPALFMTNCAAASGVPFAPKAAKLGSIDASGKNTILRWMDNVTEVPKVGTTEEWEIYNTTVDGHPIHLHLVRFEVVDRQDLARDAAGALVQPLTPVAGTNTPPNANEMGYKDTVIALPGQVTRIKAKFDKAGRYVWHCHIVEHEDNEMMRPYTVRFDPAFPDIDQNGILDTTDYNLLMTEVRKPLPRNLGYDLNGDGLVNLTDGNILLKMISPARR